MVSFVQNMDIFSHLSGGEGNQWGSETFIGTALRGALLSNFMSIFQFITFNKNSQASNFVVE